MMDRALRASFVLWLLLAAWVQSERTNAGGIAPPPPVEAYGVLPDHDQAVLSPSGQLYATVATIKGVRQVVIVQSDDHQPRSSLTVGQQKIRGLIWADERRLLVRTSNAYSFGPLAVADRYELSHVTVFDVVSRKSFKVLAQDRTFGGTVIADYGIRTMADGSVHGYFGGLTMTRSMASGDLFFVRRSADLYRVALDDGRPVRVALGAGSEDLVRDWVLGSNGLPLATLDRNSRTGTWRLIDPATGRLVASGQDSYGKIGLVGPGPDDSQVLLWTEDGTAGDQWRLVTRADGTMTPLLPGVPVRGWLFAPRKGHLLGYVRDGDRPVPHLFDPVREERLRRVDRAFTGQQWTLLSWDDHFERLIVLTHGATDPGTTWLVDVKSGKAQDIGTHYPALAAAATGPVRMIHYTARDGLALAGVLTLPPDRRARALPLIVFPHGGPAERDYPGFNWWAQALAARGYAVFQPNFRGSTGYGAAHRNAGRGQWGLAMQDDLTDGVRALAQDGLIDPARACIMGASYGGYAALAGVTLQQGQYRCAISVGGVSDLGLMFDYLRRTSGSDQTLLRNWQIDVGPRASLAARSPARLAARADAPILLIHGRDDSIVPLSQSRIMAKALAKAGKPATFQTLPGEDHWLSRAESRTAMLRAVVAFIMAHNPPDSPPAPDMM